MDMILVWHDLGYEMTNNLHLNFYFMISSCIYQYLLVSCHFSIYHKISYHIVSINIVISSQRTQPVFPPKLLYNGFASALVSATAPLLSPSPKGV